MEYGVIEFAKIGSYIVIFAFFWRSLAAYLAGKEDGSTADAVGQAMSYIL